MSKKTYYRTCDKCGSNLDPGERCDCREKQVVSITARGRISTKRKRPVQAV